MALRLSRPADAADDNSRTDRLDARAKACLVVGDLKGYRELFAARGRGGPAPPLPGAAHARRAGPRRREPPASTDVPQLFLTVARSAVELLGGASRASPCC